MEEFPSFPHIVDCGIMLTYDPNFNNDAWLQNTIKLSDINIWLDQYVDEVDFIRIMHRDTNGPFTHNPLVYCFADPQLAMLFKLTFGGS